MVGPRTAPRRSEPANRRQFISDTTNRNGPESARRRNVLYGSPFPRAVPSDGRCSSCGAVLGGKGSTQFACPSCGAATIGRCARCRDQSVTFRCPACRYEGP
ncbi:MAG: zinc finger domain-containing protein [Methanobacteriota archaeon]